MCESYSAVVLLTASGRKFQNGTSVSSALPQHSIAGPSNRTEQAASSETLANTEIQSELSVSSLFFICTVTFCFGMR